MGTGRRNAQAQVLDNTDNVVVEAPENDATETAETKEKRTRRNVDVGEVQIAASDNEILTPRASKLDTNPVALAVRDAVDGKVYSIAADPGKEGDVLSVLVRAGTKYNKGITKRVDANPDTEKHPEWAGKVVVHFRTGPRRQRKLTPDAPEVTTETTPTEGEGATVRTESDSVVE